MTPAKANAEVIAMRDRLADQIDNVAFNADTVTSGKIHLARVRRPKREDSAK